MSHFKDVISEMLIDEQKKQQRLMKYSSGANHQSQAETTSWNDLNLIQKMKVQMIVDVTYLKHSIILQQLEIDLTNSSWSSEIDNLVEEGYILINKIK